MNRYVAGQHSQRIGLDIRDSLPLTYWSNLWLGIFLPLRSLLKTGITKLCPPWQSTYKSTFKIYLWKCYKYYCDLRNDFLPEHEGECQASSKMKERSNNTQLATALTCTQQCTNLLEARSHTSFVNGTFPNFSYAFSPFPLAHLTQEHPQLWLVIIYIRLFSPLCWQKLGGCWHCCQAVHPTLARRCSFFLYSPGHMNTKLCLYPASSYCVSESFDVPSCALTTLIWVI